MPRWIDALLQWLADADVRSIIYFSSMWVYGNNAKGALTESMATAPSNPYGAAHLRNETILAERAETLGFDVSILRMANLVGSDPFFPF